MLLRHALSVLQDPATPPGLASAAVACVCQGVREQIQLPGETGRTLWTILRRNPAARWAGLASEAIGELSDDQLVREIIQTLRIANTGVDLADAVLDILAGTAAAPLLADHDLLDIAERVRGRLVYSAARVIHAAFEHRPVAQSLVAQIAEAWSHREKLARLAAIELLELLPNGDAQHLLGKALEDDHRAVRSTASLKISEVYELHTGLVIVKRCLTVETDEQVRADLLRAEAELIATRADRA